MEKRIEKDLMSEKEFINFLHSKNTNLITLMSKYKSVGRSIKRGHITTNGLEIPKRPFNNRANSSKRRRIHSRKMNEYKKYIYGQISQ